MIVNTFTNQNKDSIQKQDYNMELSEFTSNYAAKVTSKKGYNRFRWNLRHKGIKGKDKEENINGPLVKPGKYKVQSLVDNKYKIEDEILILKDPNTVITESDFEKAEELQLKIINKIREAKSIADEIQTSISSKKFRKSKNFIPLVSVPSTYSKVYEKDLIKNGFKLVIYANQLLRAAYPAMQSTARKILETSRAFEAEKKIIPIKEIINLIKNY